VFHVNWFRKGPNGEFLWPAFSQNIRVLRWIVERVQGRTLANESPIGWMPSYDSIDWTGMDFPRETFEQLRRSIRCVADRSDRSAGTVHRYPRSPSAGTGSTNANC
jgi:GTP-dependent phosphoenolpyruvate carboxykinase